MNDFLSFPRSLSLKRGDGTCLAKLSLHAQSLARQGGREKENLLKIRPWNYTPTPITDTGGIRIIRKENVLWQLKPINVHHYWSNCLQYIPQNSHCKPCALGYNDRVAGVAFLGSQGWRRLEGNCQFALSERTRRLELRWLRTVVQVVHCTGVPSWEGKWGWNSSSFLSSHICPEEEAPSCNFHEDTAISLTPATVVLHQPRADTIFYLGPRCFRG